MRALMKATEQLTPATAKKKKRSPCTPAFLKEMHKQLEINKTQPDSLNVAIFACAMTCFYSAARLGEFTVPTLSSFNSAVHIKLKDMSKLMD